MSAIDFSDPNSIWPFDPRPDREITGIPDRSCSVISRFPREVLDAMKQAILSTTRTKWINHTEENTTLQNLQSAYENDLENNTRAKTTLNEDNKSAYEKTRAAVIYSELLLLLVEYWRNWMSNFLDTDKSFILNDSNFYKVFVELIWELILEDFKNWGNSEFPAKDIAIRIKNFQSVLWIDFSLPDGLHSNCKNSIEAELAILEKSSTSS